MKEQLWSKNFILICLVNLMIFTCFYFLLPTLPIYVTDVLHGNAKNVGYIIGLLPITAVLVRPVSGYLVDTIGRKRIMISALVVFVIISFSYSLAGIMLILLGIRVIHGFTWAFISTATGTIASDLVPISRRGEGMGYFGLTNTLAMALAPILSLYILGRYGFHTLFTAGSVIAAIGLLCVFGMKGYQENLLIKKKTEITLASFFEPRVFSLSIIMLFISMTYGGVISFITLYAKQLAINNIGVFFLVYALSILCVRPFAGIIHDKKGPKMVMAIGFMAMITAYILLFTADGFLLFILSAITLGIGMGITNPSIHAMVINQVEPFRRGAATGTLFTARSGYCNWFYRFRFYF